MKRDGISTPSPATKGTAPIALPPLYSMKAVLYVTLEKHGCRKVLSRQKLGKDEKEVQRLLDPKRGSQTRALEGACIPLENGSARLSDAS